MVFPGTNSRTEPSELLSGFLKHALAQTCLRAWYQVRFFSNIFGHSWGFLYGGRGRPWYGTSAQPESHFTCSSPRRAPWVVPSTFLLNYFWAFLGGLGEGKGGAPGTVPLPDPQVTSRKACLRNADLVREEKSVHDHHRKKIFWGTFLA